MSNNNKDKYEDHIIDVSWKSTSDIMKLIIKSRYNKFKKWTVIIWKKESNAPNWFIKRLENNILKD